MRYADHLGRGWFTRRRALLIIASVTAVLGTWASSASGQLANISSTDGIRPTLPRVPRLPPRPAQGPEKAQQWATVREAPNDEPTASFIKTLQANDAAIKVIVGQGRLLTLKADIASDAGTGVIAVGDPSVVEFEALPNPRTLRLIGKRAGVTDLSITTAAGQNYAFEVHVGYDLQLLRAQLKQVFPDTYLRLGQIRDHLVVEGQARDPLQVSQIIATLESYLASVSTPNAIGGAYGGYPGQGAVSPSPLRGSQAPRTPEAAGAQGTAPVPPNNGYQANGGMQGNPTRLNAVAVGANPAHGMGGVAMAPPTVINLIRVPGVQQVMLQVRIAELNRTGLREIGADILGVHPGTGNIWGTQIAGALVDGGGLAALGGLTGSVVSDIGDHTSAFGIFPSGDFEILLRALRQNSIVSVLAEPNLIAMNGHEASFLAGGQFPVPVAQGTGANSNVTIEWKDFGVQLGFTPYVLDDESIRLTVAPEVSTIDESLGTTLVLGGDPVPGVNTRRTTTTVELREGQTLAIAGLLTVVLDGQTSRIPGLGDLPYIGPLFSNTSGRKAEKELLVLVTPCLVAPMEACQVPALPGEEIREPNDLEFYLMNRIEGRTACDHRSPTNWDNPLRLVEHMKLERRCVRGPVGFTK